MFTTAALLTFVIIVLAATGFAIAAYIRFHKKTPKPLVCPLKGNCDAVIHSEYATFAGIPLERLGAAYYLCVAVGYIVWWYFPVPALHLVLATFSGIAALFSLYLGYIQAFRLKQMCTWCVFSLLISLAIAALTAIQYLFFA